MKKLDYKKIAEKVAGTAVGSVAATAVEKFIPDGIKTKLKPWMLGAGKVILGVVIAESQKKSEFMQSVGSGIVAVGSTQLVGSVIKLSGIGEAQDEVGNPAIMATETEYVYGNEETAVEGYDAQKAYNSGIADTQENVM